MDNLLCDFAKRFPPLAADILHRDRHKRRNFREETITDLLMAGLTAFEPLGIYVDFPKDESKTGEDMDWEFVDPTASDGRCYLRLHIQAKRAIRSKGKAPYWYYRELDHAVPKNAMKGTQHKLLIDAAKALPGCVPLYMFYHTREAVMSLAATTPVVEGVNLIFADQIPGQLTSGHWPVGDRKLEVHQKHFLPLSKFLCSGKGGRLRVGKGPVTFFLDEPPAMSPGGLADRLNGLRSDGRVSDGDGQVKSPIEAVQNIPESTLRGIELRRRGARDRDVVRPRVIFYAGN